MCPWFGLLSKCYKFISKANFRTGSKRTEPGCDELASLCGKAEAQQNLIGLNAILLSLSSYSSMSDFIIVLALLLVRVYKYGETILHSSILTVFLH